MTEIKTVSKPLKVALLALDTVHASALFGAFDIFSSAGTSWSAGSCSVNAANQSLLTVEILSESDELVTGWNNVVVHCHNQINDTENYDLVFIPALAPPEGDIPPTSDLVKHWINRQFFEGAIIATACSGSVVLAETGLLDGLAATTHWAYKSLFADSFKSVELQAEKALVITGDNNRIITAGGGSLWVELVLYLADRLLGRAVALELSKLYLINWGRKDQLPFALHQERTQHNDTAIAEAQKFICENYFNTDVLEKSRQVSGLKEKTFLRRFKAASGVSPTQYLHEVRIEASKRMLAQSKLSIDHVAYEVGYSTPIFFRKLFKKYLGVTPGEYRKSYTPPGQ